MSFQRFVATSALALALAHTAACGQLSGDTGSPSTLTTIHGTITSTSTSAPASLATAIVWFERSPDGTVHKAADSVPVSGTFPASFSIALTGVPPASAMLDFATLFGTSRSLAATGVHVAMGLVVAYDDRNGNGQLDLVDASASQYIDEIEGVADRLIVYLDKSVPATLVTSPEFAALGIDGSMPQEGYNLVLPQSNYCFADAGAAGTCTTGIMWEPMKTAVTIPLGTATVIFPTNQQELMCSSGPNGDQMVVGAQSTISVADFSGALPSADDRHVYCLDLNNFQYISSCTTSPAGVCQQVNTVCTQQTIVTLDPAGGSPITPPANWPCPAQATPPSDYLSWLAVRPSGTVSGSGSAGPSGSGGSSGSGSGGTGTSSN